MQNMQRKKKVRINAVILKIKKEMSKERSLGFLPVNEKWAKEEGLLTSSWHFYMALRDTIYRWVFLGHVDGWTSMILKVFSNLDVLCHYENDLTRRVSCPS